MSKQLLVINCKRCTVQCVSVIEVEQAEICINYKNTKPKLLKTNAAIWFNKMCGTKQLTSKYFSIKLDGNNRKSRNTRILVGCTARVLK
jgi:hypothetical protein